VTANHGIELYLKAALAGLRRQAAPVKGLAQPWVLVFSVSDGDSRARVVASHGASFDEAWRKGAGELRLLVEKSQLKARWLRIDHADAVEPTTWGALRKRLGSIKRNYFRHAISLDGACRKVFLETELNANAMLYGGPDIAHCVLNEKNFLRYARIRHGVEALDFGDAAEVWLVASRGLIVGEDLKALPLHGPGPDAGRRVIDRMAPADVQGLIDSGSRYLAGEVTPSGRFRYGWHPCFDRQLSAYNTLRHASSLYALTEAWEVTRDEAVKRAIDRGLGYLTRELIKPVTLPGGQRAAVLVEADGEVKLGGNAVCLLALVKYTELTGDAQYLPLLEELALAILHMQSPETGGFVHVLQYPSLEVKAPFRIIYYDGEAAFGLMRLYGLTQDPRWLAAVERAMDHFRHKEHWKAHDHWLAYCVNELTRYRPEARYFEFGIRNFADYLDFVIERITTFPTLLELMMAAEQMLARLESDAANAHLRKGVDLDKFHYALNKRAHHLQNGHFWPELAMFYARPSAIAGSFFIRHHAFRVRIDDVEHYLSGFVAYRRYLLQRANEAAQAPASVP
jgi:hypothetical protein